MNRDENYENLRNTANCFVELEKANKRIKELEEENERLSKNQRYYKNGVFSLENDKETMSDMIDDYKSRIDQAIEFLNNNRDFHEDISDNCIKILRDN